MPISHTSLEQTLAEHSTATSEDLASTPALDSLENGSHAQEDSLLPTAELQTTEDTATLKAETKYE